MTVTIDQIVDSKSYVWTLKSISNPKTRQYWLWVQNNVIILNPEVISSQLSSAKEKIKKAKSEWKDILIIIDKSIFRDEIENICNNTNYHYLNYKVPAWVLTNFDTLLSRVKSMNELRNYIDSEDFVALTKKEKQTKIRQLQKVEVVYKWVKNLTKKPWLVIVLDWKYMSKFVDELEKLHIDNIIIANSDFDRWWNDESLVMANTNYFESIKLVLEYILK